MIEVLRCHRVMKVDRPIPLFLNWLRLSSLEIKIALAIMIETIVVRL